MEVTSKAIRDARRSAKRAAPSITSTTNNKRLVSMSYHEVLVERPISYQSFSISFDKPNPMRNFFIERGLSCPQILYWVSWSGYNGETIANLINSIPPVLFSAMNDAVKAVNFTSHPNGSQQYLHGYSSDFAPQNDVAERLERYLQIGADFDMDSEQGYQIITLDPDRGVRRNHVVSTQLATMFGMHREEMLSRIANFDLPLLHLEVDAIAVLALMMLKPRPVAGRRVNYFRMSVGRPRSYILVAQYQVSIADEVGRITQVKFHFKRESDMSLYLVFLKF